MLITIGDSMMHLEGYMDLDLGDLSSRYSWGFQVAAFTQL